MSKITTTECKDFLGQNIPLNKKHWKRVHKFKDDNGNTVREFNHPQNKANVFVVEKNGMLEMTDASSKAHADKKKRSHYVFSVIDSDTNLPNAGGHTVLIMSDTSGGEYDPVVPTLLPSHWEVHSEMEEVWSIYNDLTEDELIVALHDLGFTSEADLDARCDGRSALTSPTILARTQNQVLTDELASEEQSAPNAGKPKI